MPFVAGYLTGEKTEDNRKVIKLLEEQLPVMLYDAEWRIMSDKLNNKKYVSFTDSEKRIPKLFLCLYALILTGIIVFTLYGIFS